MIIFVVVVVVAIINNQMSRLTLVHMGILNFIVSFSYKGGIPLKDDRRISILEKLFLYRL